MSQNARSNPRQSAMGRFDRSKVASISNRRLPAEASPRTDAAPRRAGKVRLSCHAFRVNAAVGWRAPLALVVIEPVRRRITLRAGRTRGRQPAVTLVHAV